MNEPHDPNRTVDVPSIPADSLDAGLAVGFGPPADGPGSVLSGLRDSLGDLRPVLLGEAEGESAHVVKPKSDAMPSPEQTGDRYQLQGEIARGGMGAVRRGRDVDLGRDLAVKVLLEKHANRPEVARRFIEEAQIGGQLQHPGVVPVYDIGRFGDRPFFTMKLVKGQTLEALLAERGDKRAACPPGTGQQPTSVRLVATDLPRFLDITLKVAQAMAYAHAKGVIHRDLKPANVMVGAFGEVQVMDWGRSIVTRLRFSDLHGTHCRDSLIVMAALPEASVLPSGLKATERTSCLCPWRVARSLTVAPRAASPTSSRPQHQQSQAAYPQPRRQPPSSSPLRPHRSPPAVSFILPRPHDAAGHVSALHTSHSCKSAARVGRRLSISASSFPHASSTPSRSFSRPMRSSCCATTAAGALK
jgi:hypothetical protein